MGHYDLTTPDGDSRQFDHPRLLAAMDALLVACKRHGLAAGFLPATPAETINWIKKGFRAISLNSDVALYLTAVGDFHRAVMEELRAADESRL
jgi:2-dehydro-3-deoxyglucarate aldolase/4-hydroxy-2-oxoheptanedioate aldolase